MKLKKQSKQQTIKADDLILFAWVGDSCHQVVLDLSQKGLLFSALQSSCRKIPLWLVKESLPIERIQR